MSDKEIERFEKQDLVVTRYLQGQSPQGISRETGIPLFQVKDLIDGWRKYAVNDVEIRGRAREVIVGMDAHYSMILEKLYKAHDDAALAGDYKAQSGILKNIADIEKQRFDSIAKAGLLDDQNLANELAVTKQRHEQIKHLLADVTANCDTCKFKVADGLTRIFKETFPVTVEAD